MALIDPEKTKQYDTVVNSKNKICAGNNLQRVDHGDSGGPLLYIRNNDIYQIGLAEAILTPLEDVAKPGKFILSNKYLN